MIQNKELLLERLKKTKDIILPTFNYTDQLDDCERDGCEETFNQLSPAFLFMYSVVVDNKIPDSYKTNDAQLEMYDKLKMLSSISAITFKKIRAKGSFNDKYEEGFYALLETFLLLYYLYSNGISI